MYSTYLSGKIPCQELDWDLGMLRSPQGTGPLWWIGPLLDVDARGPLGILDGLVWEGAKPTQEGSLASLPVANKEELDCTIAHRPGQM